MSHVDYILKNYVVPCFRHGCKSQIAAFQGGEFMCLGHLEVQLVYASKLPSCQTLAQLEQIPKVVSMNAE